MLLPSYYPVGECTIVVRDKDTGAVKRVQKETNIVTWNGISRILAGNGDVWGNEGGDNTRHIGIGFRRVPADQFARRATYNLYDIGAASPSGPHVRVIAKTLSTPPYIELLNRINPGVATRTINVVYVVGTQGGIAGANVYAYVALSTPCIQTTTEVLDIYYRYQVVEENDPNALPSPYQTDVCVAGMAASAVTVAAGTFPNIYDDYQRMTLPVNYTPYWARVMPDTSVLNYYNVRRQAGGTDALSINAPAYNRYGMRRLNYAHTISNFVGQIFGNVILHSPVGASNIRNGHLMAPVTSKGFSPVQPIHKHSKNAPGPFLDVNFLANGSGSIFIDSSAWTNADWPEFYRIDIATTGDVATSRYSFAKRAITNLIGNTYLTFPLTQLMISTIAGDNATATRTHHPAMASVRATGNTTSLPANILRYDDTTFVSWDSTGVTLCDMKAHTYYDFDAASSPVLGATSIRQCAVDDSGNIWVACSNTGVYKITSPKGAATVTLYTTFGALSSSNAYAIDVGYNNNVFALVGGGLVRTSTAGASWTVYDPSSTPAFSFTGITDGNWNTVTYLKVQKDSTTEFRLALMRETSTNSTGFIVWWSLTTPAKVGPALTITTFWVSKDNWFRRTTGFECSRTGGWWAAVVPSASNQLRLERWEFGSTIRHQKTNLTWDSGTGGDQIPAVCFNYDRYGNPYAQIPHANIGSPSHLLGAQILTSYGGLANPFYGYSDNHVDNEEPVQYLHFGKGVGLTVTSPNSTTERGDYIHMISPAGGPGTGSEGDGTQDLSLTSATPTFAVGTFPYNGRYTPREEFAWESYRWDGASWTENYAVDAADSGPFTYDAPRFNFNPESWVFTGRSSIDVTDVGTAGNFTNQLTFAVRTVPVDKTRYGQMSLDQVLLSAFDKGRQFVIVGVTTGLGGNWRIKGDQTTIFTGGFVFAVQDNFHTASNTTWTVSSSSYSGVTDETTIVVTGTINASAQPDGFICTSYFAFYLRNQSGNMGIYNAGTFQSFGAFPGTINGTNAFNIVLTINGTAANCYVNNVQVGTGITMGQPLRLDNASGQLQMTLGGLGLSTAGYGWKWAEEFYKGTMLNANFYQGVWNSTDIGNHNTSPLIDPTTYAPAATGTQRARYQLNQSLVGLETKLTHTSSDTFLNGMLIRFANGVSSPAFFAESDYRTTGLTDHYTFGVMEGIFKDNAISYTHTSRSYGMPVEQEFGTFTPATVPASASVVTERVNFRASADSVTVATGAPGEAARETGVYLLGYQYCPSDFIYEWQMEETISGDSAGALARVGVANSTSFGSPPFTYELRFNNNGAGVGTVNAYKDGTLQAGGSGIATWTYADTFSIRRVGSTFTAYKAATPIFTWTQLSAAIHYPYVQTAVYNPYNCTLQYTRPAYFVDVGDSGSLTGKFDSRFFTLDGWQPNDVMDISFDEWTVVTIVPSTRTITISGNHAAELSVGQKIKLRGNGDDSANKRYVVLSATNNGGNTDIVIDPDIADGPNGTIPATADNTGTVWKLATIHVMGVTAGAFTATIDGLTAPGPYQVTVVPEQGHILCNSAQAGATLYGALTVVYKQPL